MKEGSTELGEVGHEGEPQPRTQDVRFDHGTFTLAGEVTLPPDEGVYPAIVLVHGAGPADRDYFGFFPPIREYLARRGITVLSYDKPGCSYAGRPGPIASSGDWRTQGMPARAREILAAVAFLEDHDEIVEGAVGVLGYSQGWWPAGLAASLSPTVAFAVCLGGASVSPFEQECFRIEQELKRLGIAGPQIREAVNLFSRGIDLTMRGASFAEVSAVIGRARHERWYPALHAPETPELWHFLRTVLEHDPEPVIRSLTCPLLLIFSGHDERVPVEWSRENFERLLRGAGHPHFTTLYFPDADHFMAHPGGTGFIPDFLEALADWILDVTLDLLSETGTI